MDDNKRPLTAKEKRNEQLKRWENSVTDVESPVLQNLKPKVKFNDGAVFLAACSSGDLNEVQILLENGADINFANIDGLTALHQACIDGNLHVVKFLVEQGTEIDQEDNEGWTPLHAAASCGFMDIARYLVRQGADVAAVNSEGEVPLDIAEDDEMIEFLQSEISRQDLDIEGAKNEERKIMVSDANQLLNAVNNNEALQLYSHPKSGATALHVAAAKGYIDVIKILLQAGVSVNMKDHDGWTALHAASHWSQKEAAKLLADKHADFRSKSVLGQTPFDVADEDMLEYLEELKLNQEKDNVNAKHAHIISPVPNHEASNRVLPFGSKKENGNSNVAFQANEHCSIEHKSFDDDGCFHHDETSCSSDDDENEEVDKVSTSSSEVAVTKYNETLLPEKLRNLQQTQNIRESSTPISSQESSSDLSSDCTETQKSLVEETVTNYSNVRNISAVASRESISSLPSNNDYSSSRPVATTQPIQALRLSTIALGSSNTPTERNNDIKEGLRKTGSFDDKMRPSTTSTTCPSSSIPPSRTSAFSGIKITNENFQVENVRTARVAPIIDARISGNINQNETEPSKDLSDSRLDRRRSHLQPVRDEEAEAQRKARSKRERKSRRSTQGVTLDVYEEAKKAIDSMKNERTENISSSTQRQNDISAENVITGESHDLHHVDSNVLLNHRLQNFAHGSSISSFGSSQPSTRPVKLPSGYIPSSERVPSTAKTVPLTHPASLPIINAESNVDIQDETNTEADINTLPPTGHSPSARKSAAQKRRRQRQERRSTGLPELRPTDSSNDIASDDEDEKVGLESKQPQKTLHERIPFSSYEGMISDPKEQRTGLKSKDSSLLLPHTSSVDGSHIGEKKSYKQLYEDQLVENDLLQTELKAVRRQVSDLESRLDRAENTAARHKIAEFDKRERKVLERKLADMEKDLLRTKDQEHIADRNEELKKENAAHNCLENKLRSDDDGSTARKRSIAGSEWKQSLWKNRQNKKHLDNPVATLSLIGPSSSLAVENKYTTPYRSHTVVSDSRGLLPRSMRASSYQNYRSHSSTNDDTTKSTMGSTSQSKDFRKPIQGNSYRQRSALPGGKPVVSYRKGQYKPKTSASTMYRHSDDASTLYNDQKHDKSKLSSASSFSVPPSSLSRARVGKLVEAYRSPLKK
ncbi:protein phosphatase 1 regulatory subunit 12B-like isoform X2 [Clavelina lepadiformis]|uniref:protein phosphatase 1 regulatory subunit 12B-like isoform X2 n=1 Tax=Clavelina lepadiformis TaxID=159417 RepID=UPI004042DCC1